MAKSKNPRPLPVRVMDVRARVSRGPREDGRWYWKVWRTRSGVVESLGGGWWHAHEAERGILPLASSEGRAGGRQRVQTIGDLLEFWMGEQEGRTDLSPRTVEVRRAAARHVKAGLGDVLVTEVDRLVVDRYRDRRLREPVMVLRKRRDEAGAPVKARNAAGELVDVWDPHETGRTTAPRSVHFEIHVLRMAWRWGREVGLVTGELARVKVRVKGYVRCRYTPSMAETAAVMRALDGWARLAILLYAGTGCRLDEVAALTWSRVDLEAAELRVVGKVGERTVPIEPPVVAALREARTVAEDPEGRVLACAYSTARAVYERFAVACKAVGVPYFPPGGLRRAAVIALYRSGEDPSVAGAVIGHSPTVAMRHYRDINEAEKRSAIRSARLGHLPDPDAKVVDLPTAVRREK